MGIEIERKFLIDRSKISKLGSGILIKQGYIETTNTTIVRVRIQDDIAFLTLKSKHIGSKCFEYEYNIPIDDALDMIQKLCNNKVIEKTRYILFNNKQKWEIDIFSGDNKGLIIAEVELEDEDEAVKIPVWVIKEVTGQAKYYNNKLLDFPYSKWKG